eukprot:Colp12_sorted_trinity150504_noHs@13782
MPLITEENGYNGVVLLATEAEFYIESLQTFPISEIGSPAWFRQQQQLEKLNMQAHLSVKNQSEEFIMELLVTHQKLPVIVHELLTIEIWKQKVLPLILEMKFPTDSAIRPSLIVHHEATLLNLLQTVLYNKDACDSLGDTVLDILDYCVRRITKLHVIAEKLHADDFKKESAAELLNMSNEEQVKKQEEDMQLDLGIRAVSILRYLTDHMTELTLSLMTRMLKTHDVILMLVPLLETSPWSIYRNGVLRKYIDGKWQEVDISERLRLTATEGQVWLALYNLLMEPECRRKYEYNSHNKNEILKLRSHFNEVLIDQLPMLGDLQRTLEELSMMDPPPPMSELFIEQVPELRSNLIKENRGKWKEMATAQRETVFNQDEKDRREEAKRLAETYRLDVLEDLLQDTPKCACCGEEATKRCSRCQNEWYCSRQCQVSAWKNHKKVCDLVAPHVASSTVSSH